MERRITEFVAALRSAGVRVSLAESADALRAIEQAGIAERDFFRMVLQMTLVKDQADLESFERLFPLYFSSDAPPALQPPGGGQLTPAQERQLAQALAAMLAQLNPAALRQLLSAMLQGQTLSNAEIRAMLAQVGLDQTQPAWMSRQALRRLELQRLEQLLRQLLEQLRAAGMDAAALAAIAAAAQANQQAIREQIERQAAMLTQGRGRGQSRQRSEAELLDMPLDRLDERDLQAMRSLVNRLAARLRSRMALRQRRGKTGTLDAKATIRTNQRFGGVPIYLRQRTRHRKPKLLILCDRSVSTEHIMTFMLLMVYTLHDQVSRTRSFAFIDHLHDMSHYFAELRPEQAITAVMAAIYPTRSYSTDLGQCLGEFEREHLGLVDHRTTVIVLGDGRNNEHDPNIAAFEAISRRAHKTIWFATEPRCMWGVYDPGSLSSDIYSYAPLCDALHEVTTLRQLADAVDQLFV
ncbi:VWA containing CoxE family protein [Oscillochloris trichoides DG-6]|uniref:VWA containing CoxE family protein n=1 Tax=Oscillochloris trichoides DG-6 TaxID=765420 RepID=E1I9V7_9CHLR|nr:VWA domain-containing protein [Oscillochloris trichoides]EFO81959.1 VWA containing CoxE family protein [Oscillochloris trichoides DG-6]